MTDECGADKIIKSQPKSENNVKSCWLPCFPRRPTFIPERNASEALSIEG